MFCSLDFVVFMRLFMYFAAFGKRNDDDNIDDDDCRGHSVFGSQCHSALKSYVLS